MTAGIWLLLFFGLLTFALMPRAMQAVLDDFNFAVSFCDLRQIPKLQFSLLDVMLGSIFAGLIMLLVHPSDPGLSYMSMTCVLGFLAAGDSTRHLRHGVAGLPRAVTILFGILLFTFVLPVAILIWFYIRNWQHEIVRIQSPVKRNLT